MNSEQIAESFFEGAKELGMESDFQEYFESQIPKSSIMELFRIGLYVKDEINTVEHFRMMYPGQTLDLLDSTLISILRILRTLDAKKSDLIRILANIRVHSFNTSEANAIHPLIHSSCNGGTCIDLASGPDFLAYFEQFQNDKLYVAIDSSFFTHSCLSQFAKLNEISNFQSINMRLEDVEREAITGHIISLRAKNIGAYVKNGLEVIKKYAHWIEPGGTFVFHEYWHALTFSEFIRNTDIIADEIKCNIEDRSEGIPPNRLSVHTAIMRKR